MSLRVFLFLLMLLAIAALLAVLYPSFRFIEGQMMVLFPSDSSVETRAALDTLLVGQLVVIVSTLSALFVFLFLLLSNLVARPLHDVVKSMKAFTEKGEHLALPKPPLVPSEVRTLVREFDTFVGRVEEAHKKDEEVARVKSDFISTAAHQLRTPLTGIRWALEALAVSDLSEEHKALVKSATDKSHELVSIVGTLLDISSIESGKYKYSFVPVQLEELAEGVARDFAPLAQKAQVSVYVERGESPLPMVRADKERIKWVFNNLIENAIRYTPAGGSVRISGEAHGSRLYMRVRDTGIGIGAEDRDNIFDRFYRAQNAIAVQNGGNGLGLYIARTIATDHEGDLTFAANETGPGTTFTLSLPLAEV